MKAVRVSLISKVQDIGDGRQQNETGGIDDNRNRTGLASASDACRVKISLHAQMGTRFS